MEKKYDLYDMPPKNSAFVKDMRKTIVIGSIFVVPMTIFMFIFLPIHFIFDIGMFEFTPWLLLGGLACPAGVYAIFFSAEPHDYFTKSYERKVGVVKGFYKRKISFGESYHILFEDDDVSYRASVQGPFIEGHRESRNAPYIKGAFFETGSVVEMFHGRRSRAIVWANVLGKTNLEDELMNKAVQAMQGMTAEEIEAMFLKKDKKKKRRKSRQY